MENVTEESSKEEQKESTCLSPDINVPKENKHDNMKSLSSKTVATESASKLAAKYSASTTNLKAEDAAGTSLTSVDSSVENLDSSADVLIMDVSPEKPVTVTSSPLKSVDTPTTTPSNETKDDSIGISIGESIESSPDLVLTRVTRRISGEPILVDSFEGGEGSSVEEITSLRESQEKKAEESPISNDTGSFKPGSSNDTISISASISERLSMNSDVQFLEDLSETDIPIHGEHKAYIPLQPVTTTSRTYSTENKHDSKNNDDSYKLFKGVTADDSGKFVSPLYLTSDGKEISAFNARPVYSTPNKIKNELPITPDASNKKGNALDDSGKCPMNFPSMRRKIAILVEVDALLHHQRGNWHGELTNVICTDLDVCAGSWTRRVSSSGNLGDVSKSVSPSSSSGSVTQYALKGSRISMASSGSSGSIVSSASTLARMLRDGKVYNSTESIKLTEQRINQLKEKWQHSEEIYKVLDFIDRYALGAENLSTTSSLKRKESDDETVKEKLCKIEETVTPVSTNKTRPVRAKRQPKVKFAPVDSSESEVPKKRQRRAESSDIIPISTNFSAGDSVFAKWGDRKFYAATLGEFTADGKWNVNFFDGDKKLLLEEFLIKAEDFTMVGHSVYASQGDDNFTPGIITGCDVKDGVLQYVVARDKGDISVPCQFIYITESQARQIRGKTTGLRTPTKVAENYGVISKRSTRSKTRMMLDSPKPSSSGTQMAMLSDSDEDGHDNGNEMNLEDVSGVEPESHGLYENGIKLKGKSVTGKMRFARAKVNDVDASVLGPVPDEGSKYFKNIHVLLTCTRPQSPKFQADASASTSTDSECYNFSTVPFVKDRLKTQLQMAGATVYNNFDDVPDKMWKSTYLISNRPNISAKYIQCVAAGIRCVCHEWVIRCCVEKKRCPLQELPLGWSLERERFFNSFDRKHSVQIKKLNLLIVDTVDKSFYKFWSKVCKLAEISVAKLNRDSNLEQVNAVISESGYRDDHVDRVMSHGIPLVTTTWLIQSILHGEPRPFDNHKNYRADYVDSD